jgi:hypothetical protein
LICENPEINLHTIDTHALLLDSRRIAKNEREEE